MKNTLPISPHITTKYRNKVARALWRAWTLPGVLSHVQRASWCPAYHARNIAAQDLATRGEIEAARQLWAAPMFKGRPATLNEARELSTDGALPKRIFHHG